jgi:hypothetical protein
MYQQQIEFFWPLTEQIPLGLDYSGCSKPTISISTGVGTTCLGLSSLGPIITGSINTTTHFTLREDTTTMIVLKKPNLLRKWLFKMLGFKWEVK